MERSTSLCNRVPVCICIFAAQRMHNGAATTATVIVWHRAIIHIRHSIKSLIQTNSKPNERKYGMDV